MLIYTQVSRLPKAFTNNSSANINLSKTQLSKIGRSGEYLEPFIKTGLFLVKNVLKPLAKSFLIPLELIVAGSATVAAIQNKIFGSGMTALIISNKEMNVIMKISKSLKEAGLLVKDFSETIENESKNKVDFSACF